MGGNADVGGVVKEGVSLRGIIVALCTLFVIFGVSLGGGYFFLPFKDSPFGKVYYSISGESFAYLIFDEVSALGGEDAWIDVRDNISIEVNPSLPVGAATVSGVRPDFGDALFAYIRIVLPTLHTSFQNVTVQVSSEEEKEKWEAGLKVARQKVEADIPPQVPMEVPAPVPSRY